MIVVMAALAMLTASRPQWLESLGIDPDAGSGSVEWLIVAACVLVVMVGVRRLVHRQHR